MGEPTTDHNEKDLGLSRAARLILGDILEGCSLGGGRGSLADQAGLSGLSCYPDRLTRWTREAKQTKQTK